MSDMNLPTVTYDEWGVQEFITETVVGTYALVPVDAMEKVWECVHYSAIHRVGEHDDAPWWWACAMEGHGCRYCDDGDTTAPHKADAVAVCSTCEYELDWYGCGWRFLVSAKEEE